MVKVIRAGIKILILAAMILSLSDVVVALDQAHIDSLKNYLIILVPSRGNDSGIFDMRKPIKAGPVDLGPFSNLKGYLETELDLSGYVYSYDFSKDEDTVEHWGWELGDRNYNNPGAVDRSTISDENARKHKVARKNNKGLCWLEQAREDFIKWFKSDDNKKNNSSYRPPTKSEIMVFENIQVNKGIDDGQFEIKT